MLPHGVYEIRNEEGKTARATGSHLKMYKSSDACCIGDEDQSSSQGDCVSKTFILVCEDHTIKRHCQSAADAFPTGDHASSSKDVISDVMHVS